MIKHRRKQGKGKGKQMTTRCNATSFSKAILAFSITKRNKPEHPAKKKAIEVRAYTTIAVKALS
jgi:hypothetical protein